MKYKNLLAGLSADLRIALQDGRLAEREFGETELSCAYGNTLKVLRTHKKLSLDALGKFVNMHPQTINRYENGVNIPTISQAAKLTEYFGMTIELFIALGIRFAENKKAITGFYEKYFDM